jgi:phage-related protein
MKKAIDIATSIITGQLGGYVVFNPKEYPEEILIMDEPDIQQAQKIWRWNLGGLAYSSTGYNGTFATAMTMDGSIVADFITTGTLNASLIKTGTLQGVSIIGETGSIAGWKMQNGVLVSEDNTLKIDSGNNTISVYDDNQNRLMVLSKSGINMYRDGKYIGFIGTNHITGTNKYGLVFDLDVDGDYMSWAKMNQQTGNYTIVLQYSDTDGFEFSDKVKINGETKIAGNTEISNITSLGSGGYTTVTDTVNFVKSITVDSNGVVTSYDTGSLSIRNGVITGAF